MQAERSRLLEHGGLLQDVLDISAILTDGAAAMVDDSFLRCFTTAPPDPWNWNLYLFPAWVLGVVLRWAVLFPLRLTLLLTSLGGFLVVFFTIEVRACRLVRLVSA